MFDDRSGRRTTRRHTSGQRTRGRRVTAFAYAPDPTPDEPLDCWLERIAAVMLTPRRRLLNDHGFFRDGMLGPESSVIRDAGPDAIARLSDVTGVDTEQLTNMTLHRWESLGLVPQKDQRGHQGGAWARTHVGRLCPECVDERDGVHRLHWRTVWSFACVRHQALLAAYDPAASPYGQITQVRPAVRLPLDHPVLRAQRTIDKLLDDPTHQVNSLGRPQHGCHYLSDLGALTRVLITAPNFSTSDGHVQALEERTGVDWTPLVELFPSPRVGNSSASQLAHAVSSPALTALAVASVHPALAQSSAQACEEQLWWVTESQRRGFWQRAGPRGISYPLAQVLTPATQKRAGGQFLMRFTLTRRDERGHRLSPLHPSKVPGSAWTSVVQRPYGASREIEGVAASAALLMIASDRTSSTVLEALGLSHLRVRIATDWDDSFGDTPSGEANFRRLLDLQRKLASTPVPINYARRRRIFPAAEPLGRNTLKRVLRALDVRE